MRSTLLAGLLLLMAPTVGVGQIFEVYRPPTKTHQVQGRIRSLPDSGNVCRQDNRVTTLERGLLDMTSQGQAQASAQLVRICIGEPDGFALPLYFLAGAAGEAAGDAKSGEATASTLLNPLGGNLALAANDDYAFLRWGAHTFVRFSYTLAARYLHMTDSSGAGVPLVVGTGSIGLRLQTAAWAPTDQSEGVGTAWVQVAAAADLASQARLARIFGPNAPNWAFSLNIDLGIKVAGRLDTKLSLYHALDDHGIAALRGAVVKAGFDFQTQ